MPDEVLVCGESGGGKAKSGIIGVDFRGWQGGSLIGGVIQLVCSSWAKKNDYFETEKWWYGAVQ